ncbi:MAG: glycosyltransferase [Coriobacteriia bacterium]|nr:glycosyltransferase [Coriobacteriia bacterium]
MRLCLLGNFRAPHSSENDYLWTLRHLGVEVVPLQEAEATSADVLAASMGSDALMWVHTHGRETPGMGDVLDKLRSEGIPTFAYHLDLYMGLGRWRDYAAHDFFKVAHFFTVDKLMADWLNANTPTQGHFLRAGVVERDCGISDIPRTRDVVFVGSYRYHPEWPYRRQLVDWLQSTYRARFELWGPHGRGQVRGEELNRLYAESKVVIGDTLCPGFDYPYYTSDRAYEVLGRGGFLIHPRITGMDEELEDGHLAYYDYGDFDGLKALIDHHLTHDSEREAIRVAGNRKVREDCTYTDRLRTILDTLELPYG